MGASILDTSALELARRVRVGEISAEALTSASLDAIALQNGALGAFLSVAGERALEVARSIDRRRERGEALGPLAGVPVGVKDVLATTDLPTTAASKILLRDLVGGDRQLPHVAGRCDLLHLRPRARDPEAGARRPTRVPGQIEGDDRALMMNSQL